MRAALLGTRLYYYTPVNEMNEILVAEISRNTPTCINSIRLKLSLAFCIKVPFHHTEEEEC